MQIKSDSSPLPFLLRFFCEACESHGIISVWLSIDVYEMLRVICHSIQTLQPNPDWIAS